MSIDQLCENEYFERCFFDWIPSIRSSFWRKVRTNFFLPVITEDLSIWKREKWSKLKKLNQISITVLNSKVRPHKYLECSYSSIKRSEPSKSQKKRYLIYIYIAYIEFELLLVEIHSSKLYLMNQEYSSENLDVIKPGRYSLNLKPNLIKNVQSMYLLQKNFSLVIY